MTLLLNDTSHYHNGCDQVMNVLKKFYSPSVVCNYDCLPNLKSLPKDTLVVLNGEGTLHDNATAANKYLTYISEAQSRGMRTEIINTVWQNMANKWQPVLSNLEILELRESLSRSAAGMGEIVLDASIHEYVPEIKKQSTDVLLGGKFILGSNKDNPGVADANWAGSKRIDIFNESWVDVVNRARNAKVFLTGRHHEMYAALCARCKVIVQPGNTWKNEGFFHTSGTPELVMELTQKNIQDTLDGRYDESWKKVWDFLDSYEYKYAC